MSAVRKAIEIVPAGMRHLDSILRIERASFGRYAYPRELFLELLEDCGGLFSVAKRSGRISGYIAACVVRNRGEIVSIAVDPRHRLVGAGSALLSSTLAKLKRAGIPFVTLMVRTDNEAAIRFYSGFGFKRVRRVPAYYEDGRDGWRMRVELRPFRR